MQLIQYNSSVVLEFVYKNKTRYLKKKKGGNSREEHYTYSSIMDKI